MPKWGQVKCRWCGDYCDEGEMRLELKMGPICSECEEAIWSRGEKLVMTDMYAYRDWQKEQKAKYDKERRKALKKAKKQAKGANK